MTIINIDCYYYTGERGRGGGWNNERERGGGQLDVSESRHLSPSIVISAKEYEERVDGRKDEDICSAYQASCHSLYLHSIIVHYIDTVHCIQMFITVDRSWKSPIYNVWELKHP